jgi:hypothetical protein
MSLNFIYHFQLKIHQTLSASEKLKLSIKEIYLSTIQDGIYPFILINLLKIDDKSKVTQAIYSIDFEICIFSRDKNKKNVLQISDLIAEVILPKNLAFGAYNIAGVKLNNVAFDEARDLVHNKLTMNYKTLLKKELS